LFFIEKFQTLFVKKVRIDIGSSFLGCKARAAKNQKEQEVYFYKVLHRIKIHSQKQIGLSE
jgi:hypothetical protein